MKNRDCTREALTFHCIEHGSVQAYEEFHLAALTRCVLELPPGRPVVEFNVRRAMFLHACSFIIKKFVYFEDFFLEIVELGPVMLDFCT